MIPIRQLKNIKRHYDAIQRLISGRIRVLIECHKLNGLNQMQKEELKTLQQLIAPMDRLSEDINSLISTFGNS